MNNPMIPLVTMPPSTPMMILVRFVITKNGNDSWRFQQAYSGDGGKTWETNWVAVDTRKKDGV